VMGPPDVANCIAEVISGAGLKQLHIAETIKYAHATYFFNGLHNEPFAGEDDVLIESVKDFENIPTMRAHEIVARVREEIIKDAYDLIVINLANADILAHTGNYDATLVGVQTIDAALANLMEGILAKDGILAVTSDHGNAESLIYTGTGAPESKHNDSPVGFYLIGRQYQMGKTPEDINRESSEISGILGDVAPTILQLMNLPQPPEMTGKSLLPVMGLNPPTPAIR